MSELISNLNKIEKENKKMIYFTAHVTHKQPKYINKFKEQQQQQNFTKQV